MSASAGETRLSSSPTSLLQSAIVFLFTCFLILALRAVYVAFLGPLKDFPGPAVFAISPLPKAWNMYFGRMHLVAERLHAKYGPVVRIGPNELSFLGSAQVWNDVYGPTRADNAKPFKSPRNYEAERNGVHSIVSANDQDHARMRKVLSPAFSDRALKEQEPILKHWAGKLLTVLSNKVASRAPTDMLKSYNCTTFDVMGDLTFGENLHMLDTGELSPWVETIFGSIRFATRLSSITQIHPLFRYIIRKLLSKSRVVQQKSQEHWEYTRQRLDRRLSRQDEMHGRVDFWTGILAKGDSNPDDGLTIGEQHANASIFMIAGTETTATALTGTTFHLLRNPKYMRKLQEEIRSTFSSFEDITLSKLAQLKYLQACLSEGLRMYPPVPIALARMTPASGSRIGTSFVPGNVVVGIHNYSTYRSEVNFAKADEFRPERWLGEAEFENDNLDAFQVFSYGPRNCIGKNLAWHEMRLLLASVILRYDLELTAGMEDWNEQRVFSLWEKVPLMCTLSEA